MTSISAKQNPTFVSSKKSLLIFGLVLTFGFIQAAPSVAAFSLTVTYRVDADPSELDEGFSMYSDTHIVGSSEAKAEQRRMASLAKQKSTQALMISACKLNDAFGARLKVTDARGGTAGLSNMNSVSVTGIKVVSNPANLPDYTEEEQAELEAEYSLYEDYPDYIEDGYIYYSIEAVCQFRGRVSLINSNAYRIFINGDAGPEYSKAELVKRKWSITLVDN
jgi:hypothetical protein